MKWEIELATLDKVQRYWPQVAGMMQQVPHTIPNYSPESLYEGCMDQQYQLWLVGREEIEFVMISHVVCFPSARVLEVFWGAGQGALDSGPIVDAVMERFANDTGCDRIDVYGRPGWEKVMKPYGFKKMSVVMSKPIVRQWRQ